MWRGMTVKEKLEGDMRTYCREDQVSLELSLRIKLLFQAKLDASSVFLPLQAFGFNYYEVQRATIIFWSLDVFVRFVAGYIADGIVVMRPFELRANMSALFSYSTS